MHRSGFGVHGSGATWPVDIAYHRRVHPSLPVSLDDVREAAQRISSHVRRTPSLSLLQRFAPTPPLDWRVTFKLEHLQVGGSFKARGAINWLVAAGPEALARGVVTASGGNHGIGVAWAAARLGARAAVFLPESAPA